jgi:hypothetical protein
MPRDTSPVDPTVFEYISYEDPEDDDYDAAE